MKKCEAWVSDDGQFKSIYKNEVESYENKVNSKDRLSVSLSNTYPIEEISDLLDFLYANGDDIRSVMDWEDLRF